MTAMKRLTLVLSMLCLTAFLIVGCSNNKTTTTAPVDDNTPVTITVASYEANEDAFNQRVGALLKQRYPNITIQYQLLGNGSGPELKDIVASSQVPDIMIGGSIQDWIDLGIAYDLTPLIKEHKMDLNQFQPDFIKSIQNASPNGQMVALPYYCAVNVMYYNKDIFDKFNVPYPKDGITWPQAYDLAKQLTRNESNVQYRGLEPDLFSRLARQYPLNYLDPKNDQAIVATDPRWTNLMQFLKSVYDIPGNMPADPKTIGNGKDAFLKDKTLAMWPYGTNHWDWFKDADSNGLHWDIVSFPTFTDSPGQGPVTGAQAMGITSTSQNKEAAFKVLSYMTSVEAQTNLAKQGLVPVLTNPEVIKQYGADIPELKGKNTAALFVDKFGVTQPGRSNPLESVATPIMTQTVSDIMTGKKDVNSALQDAADSINKAVVVKKQQQ